MPNFLALFFLILATVSSDCGSCWCSSQCSSHKLALIWATHQGFKYAERTKFNVQITDETGSDFATIFTEKAEALFDVTATELALHAAAANLPISLIEKLSAQKTQFINLKATMYDYGEINRCVFTVNSVSDPINTKELLQLQPSQPQLSQPQPPKTPSKRPQQESSKVTSSASYSDMEEDESIQPLKHKQKKE